MAIVEALHKAFAAALAAPDNAVKLASQLYEPVGAGPQEFAKFIASENDKWSKLIKQIGVRLE